MAKTKKKGKGLIIFLIILFLLVGVPCGLYFGLIFDSSHNKVEVPENYKVETGFKYALNESLENIKESKTLSFGLDEEQFTYILASQLNKEPFANFINGSYVKETDKGYDFFVEIKGKPEFLVKTKLVLSTTLEEIEDCFVFSISNIKVGRLGGLKSMVFSILSKFVNDAVIEDALKDFMTVKVDLKDGKITYVKEDFYNDLTKFLSNGSGELSFISLLNALVENEMIGLDNTKKGLNFQADLSKLTTNKEYVEAYDLKLNDSSKYGGITLDGINESLEKILNSNKDVDSLNSKQNTVFKFLFNGYDELSSEEKTFVNEFDYTSLGESFNKDTYKGFDLTSTSLDSFFSSSIENLINTMTITSLQNGNEFSVLEITEEQIVSYLSSMGLVGYYSPLNFELDEGYSANYICVDNLYCNIYESGINFVVGLNINGLETSLIINTEKDLSLSQANFNSEKFQLRFDIKDFYFGEIELEGSLKDKLLSLLKKSLSGSLQLKTDSATNKDYLLLDFSQQIMSNVKDEFKESLKKCNFEYSISGENKAANGKISLLATYLN